MSPNCTNTEVRDIIDTGLTDARLTALIVLADAEITARGLTGSTWTSDLKKQVSMLLAASLAAMNDVRSMGKEGYMVTSLSLPKWYRQQAEDLIRKVGDIAFTVYTEPDPEEE